MIESTWESKILWDTVGWLTCKGLSISSSLFLIFCKYVYFVYTRNSILSLHSQQDGQRRISVVLTNILNTV